MNQEILSESRVEVIASQSSKDGQMFCGDDYFFTVTDDYFICALADGLGSGEHAYESSKAVTDIIRRYHHEDITKLMNLCNQALLNKRGAAVAIFKADFKKANFQYSCVGNIRFYLYPPTGKLIYPLPVTGYLSGRKQRYHTQQFPYMPNSKFFLHSDGFEMRETKNFLRNYISLEHTAKKLEKLNTAASDDVTFILGSLL